MTENPERRHSQRNRPEQLVYVDLGPANGGMMLNVSEEGFSFRAVSPVRPNEKIHFALAIDGTRRLEGTGELEWTQENGRVGGLQFTDVSEEFRRDIRRWLRESQPSVGAGRAFIPAAAAPVDTRQKLGSDLKAEPPKAQLAVPLVEKRELEMQAPPTAAASLDAAEKQRRSEDVQPWKPRTQAPPIEEPKSPKLLYPVAPKVEEQESRVARPAVSNVEKIEIEKETAPLAKLPAMHISSAEAAGVPDKVKAKAVEGSAVGRALSIVAVQREEFAAQWKAVEEVQEGSSPRLIRAAAVGIVAAGMAVVFAATVFSFRREVGELLIRLGEKMVAETKPVEPAPHTTPKTIPINPEMNSSANSPSGSAAAGANPNPAEAPPVQTAPSTPIDSSKVAPSGTALEEPGQAELAVAQRILGSKNGSRNITKAIKLLWVAVQKGNSAAVFTLADLYSRGRVVAKNCTQARILLATVAKKGSTEAKARVKQLGEQGCK